MKKLAIGLFILFCVHGCGNGGKNGAEEKRYEIKRPEIPAILSSQQDRVDYYVKHFWDGFDFSDTVYMSKPDITETALADYLVGLGALPPEKSSAAVKSMLARVQEASPVMFEYFTELYERYLHDPNSPMRNEELYIPVLEYIIASDKVGELDKLRPQSQLDMALKNRAGHKAIDISFRTSTGKTMRLYDVKAEYTILYINNPDCHACAEITRAISSSQLLSRLINEGVVKVVAVYPDEDITAWRNHLSDMPQAWINGYDESLEMRDRQFYDLKAIPTLYLLDKDKTVLIKDAAEVEPIENYIMRTY